MDKTTIELHLGEALETTDLRGLGERKVGKVRDVYTQRNRLILVSTDRYSAFDRNLALIPFKGQVLTQVSKFWFEKTADIIQNHVLAVPDPNVIVARKCRVLSVEVVMRGYITGVTGTSIWTLYQKGERQFGGLMLPDGMKKNQKLERSIITPTTKSDTHDRPVTAKEIVDEGIVEASLWEQVEDAAFRLFERGQKVAWKQGLILVDTKYEFGVTPEGTLMLIDEIHTPDSSRYWQAESYEARIAAGEEPENFDKEFLRLWFKENSDPYNDKVLPPAPKEMVMELASRYTHVFEQLTGQQFETDFSTPLQDRIYKNLAPYLVS